jgi:hypothetical protein
MYAVTLQHARQRPAASGIVYAVSSGSGLEVRLRVHVVLLLTQELTSEAVGMLLLCKSRTAGRSCKKFHDDRVEAITEFKPGRSFLSVVETEERKGERRPRLSQSLAARATDRSFRVHDRSADAVHVDSLLANH